ncbi:hypothetical protein NP92_01380 [Anoxybacillus gonensis]|uniref:DUF2922 domain-containing protein n=1 Tax=Anoxybacillus gonensis TaxID=198467 RepID=A0AAW7THX1_9BACL|nr:MULTISPECIES: DUF2922 domain-containing protein [Anoxybacillus]AXM88092.1 DUF2922 domain-containing protein [Anoxybacillus ayderensis G10]THD15639.1 DUF2922 domain-containing protein [Anoxybacillus ayderensis]AKS37828.1 hypothetical protein AFK25_04580 [Anoxybacillus gonensis]EMI11281.1 hypothetical protein F510_0639 [Anoxybacillus gonensis]KGP61870.1 hypothetical protein NP92_01380 [Anoxybacillus gonensis]
MKTLELQFMNEEGKTVRFTIDAPREDVTEAQISQVMDVIIAANVFPSSGGDLIAKKGARLIDTTMTQWAFA